MEKTTFLGGVGWKSREDEEEGSLVLEGEKEGGKGKEEKLLFIDLSKGELRLM